METRANYILIGSFAVAVSIGAVLFGLWAAKFTVDTAWNEYRILFRESVMGLTDGSPVLYNGVNVGRVTDLRLNPADPREVLAVIQVGSEVPVKQDTHATIRLTGLTGTAAVQLSGGSPGSPTLKSSSGKPALIEADTSALNKLLETSEGIAVTANRVMAQLDRLFTEGNLNRLTHTLEAVESLADSLASPDGELNRLLAGAADTAASLPALVQRLEAAAGAVENTATGIDQELAATLPELRQRLGATLASLESVSNRVDHIVASNEAALGSFADTSLQELNGGIADMRLLVRRLLSVVGRVEQDPSGFLLGGGRPEEYQPR